VSAAFTHLTADLSGARDEQLRDLSLITGLLIAAVAGAGLTAVAPPTLHVRPLGGLTAVMLLEPGHLLVHALPERGLLIVDVLTLASQEPLKALEVFSRRLAPRKVHTEVRAVG
jgi:S-adenosylmethionine/arginine decarboxylase-like enzyme